MALDLGELRAGVVIDRSAVPRGLAAVRNQLQSFARQAATDLHSGGRSAGGALSRGLGVGVGNVSKVLGVGALGLAGFGAAGVAVMGAVATAGAVMGTKVAAGNEQAAISFETMLGSGKKAKVFLDDLKKFAAATPFEFPELQTAASSLISAGIEADKVIPIMTTLGDVTSGMGTGSEGVKRATIALQQMSAAGRITGEDLNQLRDAGIPVYDLLAKATGKSKGEVVKLAQAGKLGKKELGQMMEALESGKGLERFSGLMAKQSKSLTGTWSTLKDTVGQGLAGIMQNAMPLMKDGVNAVSHEAERMFKWFDKNKDSVSSVFRIAGRTLKSFGRIAAATLGAFTDDISGSTGSFKDFVDYLEEHESDIVGFFASLVEGGASFALGTAHTVSAVARGMGYLTKATGVAMGFILDQYVGMAAGAEQAFGWIPGIGPKLHGITEKVTAMRDHVKNDTADEDMFFGMADTIDHKLIPALEGARSAAQKVGAEELDKGKLRDSAAKTANAVEDIGTKANGSRLKLKKWADVSELSGKQQKELRGRIKDAKNALRDQLDAVDAAGGGQKKLTATWEKGKDKLYDEFKQMGLSSREAKKLADRYAGIQPKVTTVIKQPGMTDALAHTQGLQKKIQSIDGRKVKITYSSNAASFAKAFKLGLTLNSGEHDSSTGGAGRATGGILSGNTPLSRGDDVWLPRADGFRQPLRGGEGIYVTEAMQDRYERARLLGMNKALLNGESAASFRRRFDGQHDADGHAGGGILSRTISAGVNDSVALPKFDQLTERMANRLGDKLGAAIGQKLDKLNNAGRGLTAADVPGAHNRTSYKGHAFTKLFKANLQQAEKIAGSGLSIFQGGFRPKTSYSGTSHKGDAIDNQPAGAIIRALRKVGIASGDRTGLGNWASHAHGVPTPGHGYGAGSAVWQAQDYKRRGGASQSLRSPWGLYTGTSSAAPGYAWTGEKGAELVVNRQLKRYDGGERVYNARDTRKLLEGAGGGGTKLADTVTFVTTGKVRDDMADLLYQLRAKDQGGAHR